jgi:hypothetical protein
MKRYLRLFADFDNSECLFDLPRSAAKGTADEPEKS